MFGLTQEQTLALVSAISALVGLIVKHYFPALGNGVLPAKPGVPAGPVVLKPTGRPLLDAIRGIAHQADPNSPNPLLDLAEKALLAAVTKSILP